tara:strand:- start:6142 stop:6393 length:252 start_codon:yes stop_codon:yes gene_type:complete
LGENLRKDLAMDSDTKKRYEKEVIDFLTLKSCTFVGWEALQKAYKNDITNLGPGCSRCQKNALKRKYTAKIKKVFTNLKHPGS